MKLLPLAQTEAQRHFWKKLQPVNRVAATDTYKRTMACSSNLFAENFACYVLAARQALAEEGANGRYVMAGLEKMLYPWFMEPITPEEVEQARSFFMKNAAVKIFSEHVWKKVSTNEGYFPLDIYALPGGQTFLVKDGKYVPMMSVEGPGALVSHLEPHLEQIYAPIIQATKAKLFSEIVGTQFVEFGLRSDQQVNNHATLSMALYVGGGFQLTSDDQAVLLFPEYFKDVGTIGHEFLMAYQRAGRSLEEAQQEACESFVAANEKSALLPDVIDTLASGLPEILRLEKKYKGSGKVIMPRLDSGDVSGQAVAWRRMTQKEGIAETRVVVEDGYTPRKARETKERYRQAGFNPDEIIVGAGGYFQEGCTRDSASVVYKRSATRHESGLEASLKFSDTPGKESLPGRVRVYAQGNVLLVAQEEEKIDGEPLMVKVIQNGRIVYDEDLRVQHERAEKTWNQYDKVSYSPMTTAIIAKRTAERDRIKQKCQIMGQEQ